MQVEPQQRDAHPSEEDQSGSMNLPTSVAERAKNLRCLPVTLTFTHLEPRLCTTTEFKSKVHQGDRFAFESLAIGIPLYGEEFFKRLRKFRKNESG